MRSMSLERISRRTLLGGLAGLTMTSTIRPALRAQELPAPLVVDLEWLADRAGRPGLRLFDVSPLHVWRSGHIDSAAHAWWRDTVDPNYPVFGAVLTQGDDEAHRQRVLDSLDLSMDDDVVVYDNEDGFRAARLVWFLRFLGLQTAAMLNGNLADWQHNPFSIDSSAASGKRMTVDPQEGYYLVTQQLLDRLGTSGFQLIDIRTDTERADDLGGNMPTGQIPGSTRLPWRTLLDEQGRLPASPDIVSIATAAGLATANPTVLYGSFGVDTALPWLALTNAGFTNLQTYDRGWAEWSITVDLPREPLS